MKTKLYLIPNSLSEDNLTTLPHTISESIKFLTHFAVEEEKAARRLLKHLLLDIPVRQHKIFDLNEHTSPTEIKELFSILKSQDLGIISESGCPCVADPGSDLVLLAHQHNIEIIPLVGPSSILLGLMSSGLNGQNFAFVGYLPKDQGERINRIKFLEKRSQQENQTQIFIETPYRNQNVFEDIIMTCHPGTLLCIAVNLTNSDQYIKTLSVQKWKTMQMVIKKVPSLFLILKNA